MKMLTLIIKENSGDFAKEITSFLIDNYNAYSPCISGCCSKEMIDSVITVEIRGDGQLCLQKNYMLEGRKSFEITGSCKLRPNRFSNKDKVAVSENRAGGEILMLLGDEFIDCNSALSTNNISLNMIKAIRLIEANFKEQINLTSVSREVGMSKYHFCRHFKKATRKTFIEYLNEIRLGEAKKLLKLNNDSISSICFEVGYNDLTYFERVFKKWIGCNPSKYRKNRGKL